MDNNIPCTQSWWIACQCPGSMNHQLISSHLIGSSRGTYLCLLRRLNFNCHFTVHKWFKNKPWCSFTTIQTVRSWHPGNISLTWINTDPSMDEYSHVQYSAGWNYLFILKLQRCNRWSLCMDKYFHTTLYNGCNYLSKWLLIHDGIKVNPC